MSEPRPASLPPVLEILPEAVFALDAQGCIAAANPAAAAFCGHAREALLSRPVSALLTAESYSLLLSRMHSGASAFTAELEMLHASGAPLPVEVHAARDGDGCLHLVTREIAARRRFEDALRQSEK